MPLTDEQQHLVEKQVVGRLPQDCPMCRQRTMWKIRRQLVTIPDADPKARVSSDWRFLVVSCNECHFCAFYPLQDLTGAHHDAHRP